MITFEGDRVYAFVCVYFAGEHVVVMGGSCVKRREWFSEDVGCE
jgi:hypothetical protein